MDTGLHRNKDIPFLTSGGRDESLKFPPSISVCDVTALSFDEEKMVLTSQSMTHIPSNGTKYAYGPWIAKSGSTALIDSLKYASDNASPLNIETASEEIFDQYRFLSILRHPMDRALAGFHQIEVFWLMNWVDDPIDRLGLTWYNKTCLNFTWASETKAKGKYQCTGSKPHTSTQRRLRRLNNFLDELEEKGFWDEHITPISYIISSNKFNSRARYFDIKDIDQLTKIIATSAGKVKKRHSPMARGDSAQGMDFAVTWKELVTLSPDQELAHLAIEKLCRLYHSDVTCLPYDVPECR